MMNIDGLLLGLRKTIPTGRFAHMTYEEKFWSFVVPDDTSQCWKFTGKVFPNGYGCFYVGGREYLAHRISYLLSYGGLDSALVVMHRCDNRLCVNPSHLMQGTQKDNVADARYKGRLNPARGSAAGNSKLGSAEVLTIRRAARMGISASCLAARFGVSTVQIYRIVDRSRWTWLN